MNTTCPRCLSSSFPIVDEDGSGEVCCGFCRLYNVQHEAWTGHTLVKLTPRPERIPGDHSPPGMNRVVPFRRASTRRR